MVNIWDYADAKKIQVTCVSGDVYEGNVVCVDDVEEMYDATEDEITIETADGKFIGFKQSEISKIENLAVGKKTAEIAGDNVVKTE